MGVIHSLFDLRAHMINIAQQVAYHTQHKVSSVDHSWHENAVVFKTNAVDIRFMEPH